MRSPRQRSTQNKHRLKVQSWYLNNSIIYNRYLFVVRNVKLQKQLSRKVGDQEYPKYVVTISPKTIKKLGWKPGQELGLKVKGNEAKIKPK